MPNMLLTCDQVLRMTGNWLLDIYFPALNDHLLTHPLHPGEERRYPGSIDGVPLVVRYSDPLFPEAPCGAECIP